MVNFNAMKDVDPSEGVYGNEDYDATGGGVERGLQGANDSMAFATPKKEPTVVSTPEGTVPLDGEGEQEDTSKATPNKAEDVIPNEEDEVATPYQKTDYKKRYDNLKKHYDSRVNEFKAEKQQLEAQLREKQPAFKPPKTPEELATFKEDYADVYGIIETMAHEIADKKVEGLAEKVEALTEREQELEYKSAEQKLLKKHPDFEQIREDENFHQWAEGQPQQIQDWIYKNPGNADLAIKAIDLYKLEAGIKTDHKQENVSTKESKSKSKTKKDSRGSAADEVNVASASSGKPLESKEKIWTMSEIDALSPEEFDKVSKEIDKAFVEGRIQR